MPTVPRRNTAKKCLFGGTLLAAGLATQAAHAWSFEFLESDASVYAPYNGWDSFSGSGTWNISSSGAYGDASAWGSASSLGISAYGCAPWWGPCAEASVSSRFIVTSDAWVTATWGCAGNLFDLTNDVLIAGGGGCGSGSGTGGYIGGPPGPPSIQLLAGIEYKFTAIANTYASASLSIAVPAPATAPLLGLGALLGRRRRRSRPPAKGPPSHGSP